SANPTVSTASAEFVVAAAGAGGWEGQHWDREIEVPATSLDALIARYGTPAFAKIDVEGFEDIVLEGLKRPSEALAFALSTIQREVAYRCLERLDLLGNYGCDVALGESQSLTFDRWLSPAEMAAHIATLTHEANSGDVYCVRNG